MPTQHLTRHAKLVVKRSAADVFIGNLFYAIVIPLCIAVGHIGGFSLVKYKVGKNTGGPF